MDFITGLPITTKGFDALLTITDKFSKAIKLIACKTTTTAEETAALYIEQAYTTFGLPTKIISDRDAKFTSKFWSTLMTLLDVKLGLTSVGTKEYLIKWKGYGDLERTWESPDLDHTPEILREWNKQHTETKTKTPSRRSPRETRRSDN